MNLVLDDAEEIHSKTKSRKQLGMFVCLFQAECCLPQPSTQEHLKGHSTRGRVEFAGQVLAEPSLLLFQLLVLLDLQRNVVRDQLGFSNVWNDSAGLSAAGVAAGSHSPSSSQLAQAALSSSWSKLGTTSMALFSINLLLMRVESRQ